MWFHPTLVKDGSQSCWPSVFDTFWILESKLVSDSKIQTMGNFERRKKNMAIENNTGWKK
jgi:hypothetical protein